MQVWIAHHPKIWTSFHFLSLFSQPRPNETSMGFFDNQKDDHLMKWLLWWGRWTLHLRWRCYWFIGLLKGFRKLFDGTVARNWTCDWWITRCKWGCWYLTIMSRSRQTIRASWKQTVYFIQSKKLGLPEILLQPEDLFQKIAIFFGSTGYKFWGLPWIFKKLSI